MILGFHLLGISPGTVIIVLFLFLLFCIYSDSHPEAHSRFVRLSGSAREIVRSPAYARVYTNVSPNNLPCKSRLANNQKWDWVQSLYYVSYI